MDSLNMFSTFFGEVPEPIDAPDHSSSKAVTTTKLAIDEIPQQSHIIETIKALPEELQLAILNALPYDALLALRYSCRYFNELCAKDMRTWRRLDVESLLCLENSELLKGQRGPWFGCTERLSPCFGCNRILPSPRFVCGYNWSDSQVLDAVRRRGVTRRCMDCEIPSVRGWDQAHIHGHGKHGLVVVHGKKFKGGCQSCGHGLVPIHGVSPWDEPPGILNQKDTAWLHIALATVIRSWNDRTATCGPDDALRHFFNVHWMTEPQNGICSACYGKFVSKVLPPRLKEIKQMWKVHELPVALALQGGRHLKNTKEKDFYLEGLKFEFTRDLVNDLYRFRSEPTEENASDDDRNG